MLIKNILLIFALVGAVPVCVAQMLDTIVCKNNPRQLYALYLPNLEDASRAVPLMLFFEPAARATLPVKKYQRLADKYQIALACSYNSRNGSMQQSIEAADAVLKDVTNYMEVGQSQIILSGFSGGARVASYINIVNPEFAGVIACGATFPDESKITASRKIPYAMIVGNQDMNFLEAYRSHQYLMRINNPDVFITYKGGHDWPPDSVFESALVWHLSNMKKLQQAELNALSNELLQCTQRTIDSGYYWQAAQQLEQLKSFRVSDKASKVDSLWIAITGDPQYRTQKNDFEKAIIIEEKMRVDIFSKYENAMQLAHVDSAWRPQDWISLERQLSKIRTAKDAARQLSGERLFDFSWRMCAERGYFLMRDKQYPKALRATLIWSCIDPGNAFPFLRLSVLYALMDKKSNAIANLKRAVAKGFQSKSYLQNEKAFDDIRDTKDFQKILAQLK